MGLPIQTTPTYTCELPSDGRTVKYRPFLVKEQKVLMLARESESNAQILDAVKTLISNVTFDSLDVDALMMIDLEYLFLKIRSVSVGESADVVVGCGETDCQGSGQVKIKLDDVEVKGSIPEDNKVMLNDTTGLTLKVPSVGAMSAMGDIAEDEMTLEVLKKSIDTIFDEENVYESSDVSKEDLDEFVESLTMQQVQLISEFFEDMPRLEKEVKFQCNLCNTEQSRLLQGLQSFF
jgi:hypothetical protein